ncbi:DUF6228 family protein [Lysobacter antibioticus]|uniref:DUF6228 family protein n=1 Tax=Lysobacter antibioticus TaxID=84531 RepID=UPI001269B6B3|nr:DUF6228 family protein [Lysobacter antibioticus]
MLAASIETRRLARAIRRRPVPCNGTCERHLTGLPSRLSVIATTFRRPFRLSITDYRNWAIETTDFIIKSASTDKELRFSGADDYSFSVELRGTSIHAAQEVHCLVGASGLTEFFSRLAIHERPWPGSERYVSLEGDFSLAAACSPLGRVTLTIVIHSPFGIPEEWQVRSDLVVELGQLPGIATAANRFFRTMADT